MLIVTFKFQRMHGKIRLFMPGNVAVRYIYSENELINSLTKKLDIIIGVCLSLYIYDKLYTRQFRKGRVNAVSAKQVQALSCPGAVA